MDLLKQLIDVFLHIDRHLAEVTRDYGAWTNALLFVVVFCETGLVVTPFLPGDSLLFTAGALASLGTLNVWLLFVLLSAAAILGDTVNYWIGKRIGPRAFDGTIKFLKQEHLQEDRGLLREAREEDDHPRALRPDRPHVRAVRRRRRLDDVRDVHRLQRDRRRRSGSRSASSRATSSGTSRS